MRPAIFILAALTLATGCGRRGPLDDASLDILSRTGMHGADVIYPDGYEASLTPDDYDMMRTLISALGPIKSATEGTLDDYDYRLVYVAGMDPAIIDVKLGDDTQFEYKWGAYVYTGGSVTRFRDGVDAIRIRVETRRVEQLPAHGRGEPLEPSESR
jgi:hypothetical protein